jgi:hypothetical protein
MRHELAEARWSGLLITADPPSGTCLSSQTRCSASPPDEREEDPNGRVIAR